MPYKDEKGIEVVLTEDDLELLVDREIVYVLVNRERGNGEPNPNFRGTRKALKCIASKFETKQDILKRLYRTNKEIRYRTSKFYMTNKISKEEFQQFLEEARSRPKFR